MINLFNHKYPYTNFHELNLDWILEQMTKNLGDIEKAINEAVEISNKYTDEKTENLQTEFNEKVKEIENLQVELVNQYSDFSNLVNANIQFISNDVKNLDKKIDSEIVGANEYTSQAISNNNEYLIDLLSKSVQNYKVVNFFTGELVTVQNMFDILAQLHILDPMTYDMLANKNVTYTHLESLHITFTELVNKGNALIN